MTVQNSTEEIKKNRGLVGSLAHGLNVLMAFDKDHAQMTLSVASERTGMDRASARRYLLTLCHLGFVTQSGRLFRLTSKVMDLGYSFLSSIPLAQKAQPYLNMIRDQTGFPVALGIRDELDIVHVASANTDEFASPALTIGRRFPLAYASAGRCILAFLPSEERDAILKRVRLAPMSEYSITTMTGLRANLKDTQKTGFALVDQEMQVGIRSLAVPVFDHNANVVASFNTFTFSSIVPEDVLIERALPAMLDVATEFGKTII
ncbi:IclR family transcriptional regulator domain-containing protein [Komagataeibacter oboediens]|uniref:IclR family transcriptional regulator domain-containing protein n=1 Tax=Komagataeibacter oboediens TaxID=65958 RepID=UPI000237DC2E|nr:IclR family transcriptional regulator C-terminal domain-containing protein [Komagataeibacter oboediens]